MPQMGESIAEGTLSRWLKKVGDAVKRDEPIFEISTDKVDAEIPAPNAGVLAEILVTEGQTVPVQTIVARIETEVGAAVGAGVPAGAGAGSAAAAPPAAAPAPAGAARPAASVAPPPPPSAPATTGGARSNGNTFEERVRTRSSPLVRKMAAEHNIDVTALQGSGIAGRVTKRDLLSAIESGGAPPRPAPARPPVAPSMHAPGGTESHGPAPEAWPGDVVEPMSVMRQR